MQKELYGEGSLMVSDKIMQGHSKIYDVLFSIKYRNDDLQ